MAGALKHVVHDSFPTLQVRRAILLSFSDFGRCGDCWKIVMKEEGDAGVVKGSYYNTCNISLASSHLKTSDKALDLTQDRQYALYRAHQVHTLPHTLQPRAGIMPFTVAAEANSNVSTVARRWWPPSTANPACTASSTATKASPMSLRTSGSLHMKTLGQHAPCSNDSFRTASEQSSDPVKAYSVDVTKNPKATDFLFIHQSPSPVVFRDGKDFIYLEVVRRDESSLSTIKFLNIPRRLSSASKTKYAKVLQSVARLQIFELVLYL